ncbi:hypothetical protein M569_09803, partial [Genlisea aurea]
MRTLCPDLRRRDGLDTVLEVPIPEETFQSTLSPAQLHLLLGLLGAPLIPMPLPCCDPTLNGGDHPIGKSMARYIVRQYVAASGGDHALDSIHSMYAVGKVDMEFIGGESGEVGGFVVWQKRPNLWSFELMVSGAKISAGSDGKVVWHQTPWQDPHASRGPPRPLRRLLQGLDPRLVADVFSDSVCTGEKRVRNEDCFVLKVEAEASTLRARSSAANYDIIRHTLWGCFSQKTGLLIQIEDSHLVRLKGNDVFWETATESFIRDYRTIEGINIPHRGRTDVSLLRFGGGGSWECEVRTRMQEIWVIEEVGFNIKGLSPDSFLPPAELKAEDDSD